MEESPEALAARVVERWMRRGETIACCESLTAGLLSATMASVPGASAVLRGGLVVYATDLKEDLAGVPAAVLREYGPVARQTALFMAAGARSRLGATWAVALTGVAGPEPQDGHPVGEVWLGLSGPGVRESRNLALKGDRATIRQEAVCQALRGLLAAAGEQ